MKSSNESSIKSSKLSTYKEKRDFEKTNEPKETDAVKKRKGTIFVVQEHNATRLHYDFRLEIDGVLRSWAVPKGIPTTVSEKHLAVETEDHPIKYADFQGQIPKGEYGAGKVKIWDKGNYRNIRKISMKESYLQGQIEVNLKGRVLKGNYALVNTKFNENKKNWLIIKMKDDKYDFSNG
ncbi:MAG: DNA polymerase ligase N-terminal domain-containing protein [Candidatus Woesearchaeota archaeon]|jgi:DNA ligase D-like protein (predicted 3'-phosphoesterase)